MTKLRNHQSGQTTKLLLIGDTGAGKTGSIASLAAAGYNIYFVDVDNGLDVLRSVLTHPASPYPPDAADRVSFVTMTDKMKQSANTLIPITASVWTRVIKLLNGELPWGDEPAKKVLDMTPQDVLVIDSLTFLSKAALAFILSMNGRLGKRPQLGDWGDGQALVEGLLEMLYDENVRCNVIMISHITFIGEENGPVQGYPSTLGKALPPKVGRYFNSTLQVKSTGIGSALTRKIVTQTVSTVELKNANPLGVKKEYPLATGLADFFKDVRSGASPAPDAPQGPAPTAAQNPGPKV